MEWALTFAAAALLLFCYFSLCHASCILNGTVTKRRLLLLPAALSAAAILTAYHFRLPLSVFNLLFMGFIMAELMLFLKAKPLQALFGSSIIVVHVSSLYLSSISLLAFFLHCLPYEVYHNPRLFLISVGLAFTGGLVVVALLWWLIPVKGLTLVSNTRIYAGMISAISVFIVIYSIVDYTVVMSKEYYSNFLLSALSTAVLTILLLYTLLTYSIDSAKMAAFKHRSDVMEQTLAENLRYREKLQDTVLHDTLTSCYNRNYIHSMLKNCYETKTADFMVIFMDVNSLKYVNDTFGHDTGDQYIINVSKAALKAVRSQDYVARVGGDEFLIVLMQLNRSEAERMHNQILLNIAELDKCTEAYKVSVSTGSVYVDQNLIKSGIHDIIQLADKKMLAEKEKYYQEECK